MGLSVILCANACMLIIILLLLLWLAIRRQKRKKLLLPPSPPGQWPFLGHLHLLQQPLHLFLHKLSHTYGPFFVLQLGSISVAIVSSPYWAKEFLHTHDRDFADRPQFEASKRILYNNKTMITMEHCPMWRHLRKLYTVQILSVKRIEMFEVSRYDEMATMLKLIESQALEDGAGIDMRKVVFNAVGNMMTRMLFSKRSFDVSGAVAGRESRFKEVVKEVMVVFGTPVLGDLIPWLGWLDIKGCKKRMDRLGKELDMFFEDVVVERIERGGASAEQEADSDYLDLLLQNYNNDGEVDKESIKCILLDLLISGTETMTTAIEWVLGELLRNPNSMKKLQEELDTLDAALSITSKCITDGDVAKLTYLQAVIKETMRLHPPLAINLRQMCKNLNNGIKVGGYHLPKKTRLFLNLWALGRDSTTWGANADTFYPERFLSSSAPDLRGQHFEFLPFGTGRRGCPGMNMALTIVPFVVANLVKVFDWKIPDGALWDPSESNWKIPDGALWDLSEVASSFTAPMAKALVAIPSLRERS